MSHRVTLSDVAREAGVHASTASRALNEATRSVVNPQTVRRVLAVADQLGYRPHPLARGLRTNRTMTVGCVIPDIENPLFGSIIAGAEERLARDSYSLLIADERGDSARAIETLLERRIDGLIQASAARVDQVTKRLVASGVPVVQVNRYTEGVPFPSIVGDDFAGIESVVEHLVALGHTKIGHVAGPRSLTTGLARCEAFFSSMQSRGIDTHEAVEEATWFQVEPGYVAASALLDRRPDLTAIVAANDLIALGCYRTIRERGLEVGGDISVVGYNDLALLDLMEPPMTSVRVPYREMGGDAASIILTALEAGKGGSGSHQASRRLVPELIVRDSTRPPP